MKKIGVFVGLILLTVVLSLAGILGDLRTAIGQDDPSSPIGPGTKLCSAVVSGNWRDTISVPATWNPQTCATFAAKIGAQTYQLGCVFGDSFSWASSRPPEGQTKPYISPEPNCGW
ncbi:hypothetical protein IQ274_25125 [Nostoc sp. LEGE 12447]|uniref:hypothetical protein n=1 Tax=Nostoc sp. LEGE 12447 TaxID=1828640 RepID=UPI001883C4BD|nr:hypothetical protein [Nostoc sp. LEGE 12447]MBE9001405.1 hypothetical protein [Nostoc sp. LEGE 12447]